MTFGRPEKSSPYVHSLACLRARVKDHLTKLEPAFFPFHTPPHCLLEPLLPPARFRAMASTTPTYPRPQESVSGRPYERLDSTRLLSSPGLFPNQRGNSEVVCTTHSIQEAFFFFFNLSLWSFSSHTLEERKR